MMFADGARVLQMTHGNWLWDLIQQVGLVMKLYGCKLGWEPTACRLGPKLNKCQAWPNEMAHGSLRAHPPWGHRVPIIVACCNPLAIVCHCAHP